jgi:hypothetical protein
MLIGRNDRPKPYIKPPFNGCIVIQGPTYGKVVDKLKEYCKDYQLIFSTWEDTDSRIFKSTDIVLYNKMPPKPGDKNYLLQQYSTIKGLEKAKELGWDRAFKLRSDCWLKGPDELFKLFDKSALNIFQWVTSTGGYVTDFFMEGSCDDLITMWSGEENGFPEKSVTTQIYKNGLNKKIKFFGDKLEPFRVDIYTEKRNYWFSTMGWATELPEVWQ